MYKRFIDPLLNRFDSETTHVLTREALHLLEGLPLGLKAVEMLSFGRKRFSDPRLRVSLEGMEFENPLLVGAGWDKPGRAVRALWHLGFAGVEVGSVLMHPQPGNPKPRQFMIGRGVALNRLGFNAKEIEEVFLNLKKYDGSGIPIGISIGKNKDVEEINAPAAHAFVVRWMYDIASYFVINVSSPNTPNLRALQDKEPLTRIVQEVLGVMDEFGIRRKPLFVKIAPELTREAVDDVIEVALDNGLTGIIATNTTVSPELKARYGERWRNEAGGLSGDDPDFRKMSTEKVAYIYRNVGDRLKIIGVGGVKDAESALEKIMAGASLVQVVTAIRGEGPTVAGRINRGLVEFMEHEGVKSIQELVGGGVRWQ